MSARALYASILFLGLLLLLSNFLISGGRVATFTNTTANGTQVLSGGGVAFGSGLTQTEICMIPLTNPYDIGGFIITTLNALPLVNCITGFAFFLFSFQGFTSTIGWLQIILFANLAVIVYLASGLLRGGK